MQELTDLCKQCLGCMRLEDENFKGIHRCKWNTRKENNDDICSSNIIDNSNMFNK